MIKPAPGYILIEPLEAEGKTTSGLLLAENAKDKPIKGKVINVGKWTHVSNKDIKNDSMEIQDEMIKAKRKGKAVIFRKWGGQDVTDDNKEYKLVKFDEILGVVE